MEESQSELNPTREKEASGDARRRSSDAQRQSRSISSFSSL